MRNNKLQITNYKQIQNSNDQNSKSFVIWCLVLGICLKFGAWDLVLSPAPRRRGWGFTLLEFLIIITILLIVGGVVFSVVIVSVPKGQAARVLNDFNMMKAAFRLWMADTNNFTYPRDTSYPAGPYGSCGESEPALSQTDLFSDVLGRAGWNGPYLSKIPYTPWGREYLYDNDNDTYSGDGSGRGVNVRLVWCTRNERKQHEPMLEELDKALDNGDGRSAGSVRWSTGDQSKADILLYWTSTTI